MSLAEESHSPALTEWAPVPQRSRNGGSTAGGRDTHLKAPDVNLLPTFQTAVSLGLSPPAFFLEISFLLTTGSVSAAGSWDQGSSTPCMSAERSECSHPLEDSNPVGKPAINTLLTQELGHITPPLWASVFSAVRWAYNSSSPCDIIGNRYLVSALSS